MTGRLRLMGLISGAAGVLALFTPVVLDISPVRAMLFGFSDGDIEILSIAAPSLLAIPIAAWQVRRITAPLPTQAEILLAYILSTIAMLPVFIVRFLYFRHALQGSIIGLAALIVYCCAAVYNVSLLVRNRLHKVPAGVAAEVYLLLGYLPHALYALIAFSYWSLIFAPRWSWGWGAYIVLATCVMYAAQALSVLRSCRPSLSQARQALLVLAGITASWRKRRHLRRYFNAHCDYDVFVPNLPYRRPLTEVAAWYTGYLANVVKPERYDKLHCIAYIGAGALLRSLPPGGPLPFERMVCFRGPYQELVAARLVQRTGRWLAGVIAGKSVLDLADGWPGRLPLRRLARHEALIVEQGRSRMDRWLGISNSDVRPESWLAAGLLPTAEAVLHVPESHDDVYTADHVLAAALEFMQHGAFPNART